MTPLPPGSVIGILGGGQLGRMTALAAARLGYRCHILTPERDAPASQVSAATTLAAYDDAAALARFAQAVQVVTYEFENIPHAPVAALEALVPVRPSAAVLRTAQDRLLEKEFLNRHGVATTAFRPVADRAGLDRALAALPPPAILKTARLGYDGKGQSLLRRPADADAAWAAIGAGPAILEAVVDFACEVSVVVARGLDGHVATYVPVENQHRHHILDRTIAPAHIAPELAMKAEAIAHHIAETLGLVGVLAVEMFVTRDDRILVNELAPRPHNSGHWTIDACATSQFEQLVRAVCGLPLGSAERHADAVMQNLIGDAVARWPEYLRDPAARLHLYGKAEARPGRKMGHVTYLSPRR